MKITKEWLELNRACIKGKKWVIENYPDVEELVLMARLISADKLDWANWLIVRIMTKSQCLEYVIFLAEQVIDIFEKKFPNDNRPRDAITAAKLCLDNNTGKNRLAAYAAANAVNAVNVTYAAANAAYAAAYAAEYAAANAENAAAYAAENAAYAAGENLALHTIKDKMLLKILNFGMILIKNNLQRKSGYA